MWVLLLTCRTWVRFSCSLRFAKSAPPIKGDQVLFQPFCGLFHSATTPYAFLRRCSSCNATLPPWRVPIRATVLAVGCCCSQEPLTRSAQRKQNVRLPSSMCSASHLKQARANSSSSSSSSSPFLQDTSDAEWADYLMNHAKINR